MNGHHHRRSPSCARAVLLVALLGWSACGDRAIDDGMAEPIERPPEWAEWIERHEQACEEWCTLVDACGRDESLCTCTDRDFSQEHVLCVEKAALRLECEAALTCEEIDLRSSGPVQDQRCRGENVAETAACFWD